MSSNIPNSIFAPSANQATGSKKITVSKSRFTKPITYYAMPANTDQLTVKLFGTMLAFCATSTDDDLGKWKSLLASIVHNLLDSFCDRFPKDMFRRVVLNKDQVQHLRQWKIDQITLEEASGETIDDVTRLPASLPGNLDLPKPAAIACEHASYANSETQVIAHFALIVFLAGKSINDSNRIAITERRPRAMVEKYKIEHDHLLAGPLKMSNTAHEQFHQAWLELSALRSECFREFAAYSHNTTDLQQDIILVTVNLMRFMQMQHAVLIHKFLLAYPWVANFHSLRKYVALYHENMKVATAEEEYVQPFLKLIYGDKKPIFARKDLGPLIACALAAERETSDTLMQYYQDESFNSVVSAFEDERERRNAIELRKQGATLEEPAPTPDEDEEMLDLN